MPLFSVLVPTRNRAHLLRYALQSIITQDFDDYEVVISDNCSVDDTRLVVTTYVDKRIRYVRPDTYLVMHDHWEFARKHAIGDYLLFLGDDDCLTKSALQTLAEIIQATKAPIVGCRSVDYYSNDYWVESLRNKIHIERFSGKLINIDAQVALCECFRFDIQPYYYPRVTVPVARALVDSIASRVGRFFDYHNPEYVGFAMAYSMIDQFPFLDKPLVVLGRTPDSLGPRYFWSNTDPSWRETTGQPFVFVPLKGTYMTNGAAESFLRAKNYLPDKFQGIELSWVDYYRNYYWDMLTQRGLGRDIWGDLEEFYRVVESLDLPLRTQISHSIKDMDLRKPLWYKLLRKTRSLLLRTRNLVSLGRQDALSDRWIDGSKIGVSDILTCAKWLESQNNETKAC